MFGQTISTFLRNTQRGDDTQDLKLNLSLAVRCTTHTDPVNDLGVFVSQNVHILCPVEAILCQSIELLGLIRRLTHYFSSLRSLPMSCFVVVRSKLEYLSVVGNFITPRKCCKLGNVKRK